VTIKNRPPLEFEEAVAWFKAKAVVTDEEYEELSARAKRRAFKVAEVTNLRVAEQVYNAIDDAVANGTTLEDFKSAVGSNLTRAWGEERPWMLETVFRTNVQSAYSAGRWAVMTEDDALEERPYWRFDAILDGATSDVCRTASGTVLPADSSWWRTHTPPLHHRCRSVIVSMDEDQAKEAGITKKPPTKFKAADGFGAPPTDDEWEPDLSSAPPVLVRAFNRKYKSK